MNFSEICVELVGQSADCVTNVKFSVEITAVAVRKAKSGAADRVLNENVLVQSGGRNFVRNEGIRARMGFRSKGRFGLN